MMVMLGFDGCSEHRLASLSDESYKRGAQLALSGGRRQKFFHLLEEAGPVGRIHRDDLHPNAVILTNVAHDRSAPDLPDRKIQQNLNQTTQRELFLRANEESTDPQALHERYTALRACLPRNNHTFWGFDARIFSLLGSEHSKAFKGGDFSCVSDNGPVKSPSESVEFLLGPRLFLPDATGGDVRQVIIFPTNGIAR